VSAEAESARIRAELLRTAGAMRCTLCTVITQGGGKAPQGVPQLKTSPGPALRQDIDTLTDTGAGGTPRKGASVIVVLHRERSEKLARRWIAAVQEQAGEPPDVINPDDEEFKVVVAAFDSLIQDGLISEREE